MITDELFLTVVTNEKPEDEHGVALIHMYLACLYFAL